MFQPKYTITTSLLNSISQIEAVIEFLQQGMDDAVDMDTTVEELTSLLQDRRQAAR